MSSIAIDDQQHFTYADYLTWSDDERWELIDGIAYNMTPAPSTLHQEILIELAAQIHTALRGQPGRAFAAPFDVRLPEKHESAAHSSNVVQPDLSVVCDSTKIDEAGCVGAPDFVIEIISPSTASKDQIQKTSLYERHGVKEYWIIHPQDGILTIRRLGEAGLYGASHQAEFKGTHAVEAVPGLTINLDPIGELRAQAYPEPEKRPSPSQRAQNATD